jgi:crotonobetainyl-CoA:carnitine CoA-transferase CaiB-like acyl-CoA transferase
MLPLPLPLIRVLDLTTSVAGAAATRTLADLGAEVIVIERADLPRDTMARFGRNKFSCVVDPAAEASRDLLLRVAASCNVVLKDGSDDALSTPDYDALRAVRDDIVLAVIAEGGERPGIGNVTAGAVMTALFHVRYRGQGQQVTVAFSAAGASMRTAPIVAASAGAARLTPDLPPSGCYVCHDGSLALAVRSVEDLAALGAAIGATELVDVVTGGEALRETVVAWTASRAAHAAAAELRAHGVAAQQLLSAAELPDDPHLRARGIFEPVASEGGVVEVDGPRIQYSATPLHTRFAAPAAGEHTEYVLSGLLGLSDAEIAALVASGAVPGAQ